MPPDARPIDIDPGILFRKLLHSGYLIGQSVVAHVAVIKVVELLRTERISHAVDLHHDEAKLGQRLSVTTRRGKRAASDTAALGTGIDLIDDGIFFLFVEV